MLRPLWVLRSIFFLSKIIVAVFLVHVDNVIERRAFVVCCSNIKRTLKMEEDITERKRDRGNIEGVLVE